MFDLDLAEVMRSSDLGERRDDRKIQGAGPGRRRRDANRLFQQVSRILVEKRVRSHSPAVGLNKGQLRVSRACAHRRFASSEAKSPTSSRKTTFAAKCFGEIAFETTR